MTEVFRAMAHPIVTPGAELNVKQVRPFAYRVMSRRCGLTLKVDAVEVLTKFLGRKFGLEWREKPAEKCLEELAHMWKEEDRGLLVAGDQLAQLIRDWENSQASGTSDNSKRKRNFEWRNYFRVVNAHSQRRFHYNTGTKKFETTDPAQPRELGGADTLTKLFTARYNVLYDRMFRDEMFIAPELASTHVSKGKYSVTSIKNMRGHRHEEFFLFGMLTHEDEGPWKLSDVSGSVILELTDRTEYAPQHYYCPGNFVLCYGMYMGDYFQVGTLGPPPVERREATKEAFGNVDFFGLVTDNSRSMDRIDPAIEKQMVEEEKKHNHRIVILGGDLHLDKLQNRRGLGQVLARVSQDPPLALVLSGSFVSQPFQPGMRSTDTFRDAMNSLADILDEVPDLTQYTKIVIVPGDNDPWHSVVSAGRPHVWPLRPIPSLFTGRITLGRPNIVFASNPTRICYLSKELVIARDECGRRMRKTSIVFPTPSSLNADPSYITSAEEKESDPDPDPESDGESDAGSENDDVGDVYDANTSFRFDAFRSQPATGENARKVMATLLDQCHISPFPLDIRPVVWECDHALSMPQWPSALCLIDNSVPQLKQVYEGCHVMNSGTFAGDLSFKWLEFWPESGCCEFQELPVI